jgi:hypothetical protein
MSPKKLPDDLAPLPKLFETFEAFVAGTFETRADADAHCKKNPGMSSYALRKTDPATGVAYSRYGIRPTHRTPEKTEDIMNRLRAEKEAKTPIVTRNGIASPSATSVGAKIWALCDDLYGVRKAPFTKSVLLAEAKNRNFNEGNTLTECSRWRKFHGMEWKP